MVKQQAVNWEVASSDPGEGRFFQQIIKFLFFTDKTQSFCSSLANAMLQREAFNKAYKILMKWM